MPPHNFFNSYHFSDDDNDENDESPYELEEEEIDSTWNVGEPNWVDDTEEEEREEGDFEEFLGNEIEDDWITDEDWLTDLRREAKARAQILEIRQESLIRRIERAVEEARKRLKEAWSKKQRQEIVKTILDEFFGSFH